VFELVTSRHPVDTWWDEIARVLRPGGSYLSQQVGPGSLADLSEFLMGPLPAGSKREPDLARGAAEQAGLVVTDLRCERPRTAFFDIGAVVFFLRLVVWIVPGFTVDRYRCAYTVSTLTSTGSSRPRTVTRSRRAPGCSASTSR